MPEVLVRGDDVADQLLEFLEVRETPLFLAGPKGFAVDPHLEHSAGAGFKATSPSSDSKVVRSSCAIHAERSSQRQSVQYSIPTRGLGDMATS